MVSRKLLLLIFFTAILSISSFSQEIKVRATVEQMANLRLGRMNLDKGQYYKNEPIIVFFDLLNIGNLPFYAFITDAWVRGSIGYFPVGVNQNSFAVLQTSHLDKGKQPITFAVGYSDLIETEFSPASQFNIEIIDEEPVYSDEIYVTSLDELELGQDNTVNIRITSLLDHDLEDVYVYSTYYGVSPLHIDRLGSLQPEEYEIKILAGLEDKPLTVPLYAYSKKEDVLLQKVITFDVKQPEQNSTLKASRDSVEVYNAGEKIFYGKLNIKQYKNEKLTDGSKIDVNLFPKIRRKFSYTATGDYAVISLNDFLGNELGEEKIRLNYKIEIIIGLMVLFFIAAAYKLKNLRS